MTINDQGKFAGITNIIPGRFLPPYPTAPWPANHHLIAAMKTARLAMDVYSVPPKDWTATEDRFHAYWTNE